MKWKIDLSQLFCELRTLPELHINWKWKFSNKQNCIGKDHFQSKTYFVCMCNISISQKVNTIPPLYPLFKWSVPFDPQIRCRISVIWLFALHFHFICNSGRVLNSQKSCGRSMFSLHMKYKNRVVSKKTPIQYPLTFLQKICVLIYGNPDLICG